MLEKLITDAIKRERTARSPLLLMIIRRHSACTGNLQPRTSCMQLFSFGLYTPQQESAASHSLILSSCLFVEDSLRCDTVSSVFVTQKGSSFSSPKIFLMQGYGSWVKRVKLYANSETGGTGRGALFA